MLVSYVAPAAPYLHIVGRRVRGVTRPETKVWSKVTARHFRAGLGPRAVPRCRATARARTTAGMTYVFMCVYVTALARLQVGAREVQPLSSVRGTVYIGIPSVVVSCHSFTAKGYQSINF